MVQKYEDFCLKYLRIIGQLSKTVPASYGFFSAIYGFMPNFFSLSVVLLLVIKTVSFKRKKMKKLLRNKGIHKKIFLALCRVFLMASSIINAQAQLCFNGPVNYASNLSPCNVTSGDFNTDGFLDLANTNFSAGNISILFGNGTGSFSSPSFFAVGMNPSGIVSDDFNGDGKPDLAVTNTNVFDNSVSILIGNGAGSFSTSTTFTTANNPCSLVSHDFNNDGKKDLAIAIEVYSVNVVSLYFGNGNGTFGAATNFSVGLCPMSINKADLNNDGKMDLITANYGANNISVLLGNGVGSFSPALNFWAGSYPDHVEVCDLNGDSKIDLAVCNYSSANISVFYGNGAGTFGPANTFTVGQQPSSSTAGDYNGDGKTDLAIALYGSNSIAVKLGNGIGGFTATVIYNVGLTPRHIISRDVNGDNKKDLINTNLGYQLSVFLNGGPIITAFATPSSVCAGNTVALFANGADTYTWSGGISSGVPFTLTTTSAYTVVGTNTNSGCSYGAVVTVTANSPPLSISGATALCTGNSTTLSASGANSYTWSFGSNSTSVTLSPSVTTTYTLSGTDQNGCIGSKTLHVVVNSIPILTVTGNPLNICSGSTSTLFASGAGTYSWSNGSSNSVIVISPPTNSVYFITGVNSGCPPVTQSVGVSVNPTPTVTVIASSTLLCSGQSVSISVSGANSYLWNTGSTASMIVVSPSVTTTYTATGINPGGCFSSTIATITVVICTLLESPLASEADVRIYPNPVISTLFIESTLNEARVELLDITGKVLATELISDGKMQYSMDNFPGGIYILKVTSPGYPTKNTRIVKQ
jgi:hypothetical protein